MPSSASGLSSLPRLIAAALVLSALAACSTFEERLPEPSDFPVHGIDVSKYQGNIDWYQAKAGGVRFAYVKATEGGDHSDVAFMRNWNGARAAGIPTGAYHFYYFCRPVEDQIAWFRQNVPVTTNALPPVLDMEWNGESKTCRYRPPKAKIVADMHRFLNEMELAYGKKPVIYTTVDFHREVLAGEFVGYDFWIRSVAGHPSIRYGDREWTFWQHTATGRVPGVPTEVDRNVFAGSEKEWRQFASQPAILPDPTMVAATPVAPPEPTSAVALAESADGTTVPVDAAAQPSAAIAYSDTPLPPPLPASLY